MKREITVQEAGAVLGRLNKGKKYKISEEGRKIRRENLAKVRAKRWPKKEGNS